VNASSAGAGLMLFSHSNLLNGTAKRWNMTVHKDPTAALADVANF